MQPEFMALIITFFIIGILLGAKWGKATSEAEQAVQHERYEEQIAKLEKQIDETIKLIKKSKKKGR